MPIRQYLQDVAPFWDKYDSAFAGVLSGLIILGYATFVQTISPLGLVTAWADFIENSGLLALLTAWTAIIGLYRLRHRPDKTRPTVREDFKNCDEEGATDFGLRNFGPGPALYVQAVATVEQGEDIDEVAYFPVHEYPIHLREGEFASLLRDAEENWLAEMAEKYEIGQTEAVNKEEQENPPMVNLYFSYVSQSGAREPTHVSTKRDDEDILDKIKDPNAEARHIELLRVNDACSTVAKTESSEHRV